MRGAPLSFDCPRTRLRLVAQSFRVALYLLLLAAVFSCTRKQVVPIVFELEETATRGPLEVTVRVEKKEISLAAVNRVEVEAKIDPGYEVLFPDLLSGFSSLIVRDFIEEQPRIAADGKKVYRRQYEVEPSFSGEMVIDPFEVRFVKAVDEAMAPSNPEDGPGITEPAEDEVDPGTVPDDGDEEGKEYVCETKPMSFQVVSLADAGEGIPDIKGLKAPLEFPKKSILPWVLRGGGGLLGVILLGLIIWLYSRRKRPEVKKVRTPPHLIAYAELNQLREDDLIGQGLFEEFYVRLSGILRRYIEGRFGLRAPERTTEEFLAELSSFGSRTVFTDSHRKALEDFLVHTDLVKFAALTPEKEDIQQSFDLAKNFIEETKETRKVEAA